MKCVWALILLFVHGAVVEAFESKVVNTFEDARRNVRITSQCNDALALYVQNLQSQDGDQWALKMLDATSKIPVGLLFSYNLGELGQFDQCLDTESQDGLIKGKYCLGQISLGGTAINVTKSNLKGLQQQVQLRETSRTMTNLNLRDGAGASSSASSMTWAICLPSDCSDRDVAEILHTLIGSPAAMCQTKDDLSLPLTNGAIATIVILAYFVALLVASTAFDLYYTHANKEPPYEILVAFSVYKNGRKLFKTSKNSAELSCLNGIKLFSMLWVIIGHVFSTYFGLFPITNFIGLIDWVDSLQSMIIVSGTLSVDSFFLVGGALVVYGFMKAKHNGVNFNIFYFYLHRYLRLTPALAAAVLVSANLLVYMGTGPKWYYVDPGFQKHCRNWWWTTLLYVQNYVNDKEMCIGQTWYLSVDMQLYILSPLLLLPLWRYPKIGVTLIISCILAFIIVPFYVAYDEQLSALITSLHPNAPLTVYMEKYYYTTHTRAAPWVMGALLGYLLANIKFSGKRPRIGKPIVILVWVACIALTLTCIFAGHSTLRGEEYDRWANAFYIALVRPVWALCLSWVILACVTGYGGPINTILSLPVYQILNRFTYSIYLLHLTIISLIAVGSKTGVYFSFFNAAYSFWGLTMFSFGLSILWVLAFESPMIVIEKLIFKGINRIIKLVGGQKSQTRGAIA